MQWWSNGFPNLWPQSAHMLCQKQESRLDRPDFTALHCLLFLSSDPCNQLSVRVISVASLAPAFCPGELAYFLLLTTPSPVFPWNPDLIPPFTLDTPHFNIFMLIMIALVPVSLPLPWPSAGSLPASVQGAEDKSMTRRTWFLPLGSTGRLKKNHLWIYLQCRFLGILQPFKSEWE